MEARGILHIGLIKLNQSIESCQIVCSARNRKVKINQHRGNRSTRTSRRPSRATSILKKLVYDNMFNVGLYKESQGESEAKWCNGDELLMGSPGPG